MARGGAGERKTSVRRNGYLRASETGARNFRIKSNQAYRVRIDDQLVADLWELAWPTSQPNSVWWPARSTD